MSDTPVLALPLLQPAQAQKHVTVNEAFSRLDALTQLTLVSTVQATPPGAIVDGDVYAVPPGAVNAWAGQDGRLALAINGGWDFVTPGRGWRASVLDAGCTATFDGSQWRLGAATLTPNGAGMAFRSIEIVVNGLSGATVTTPVAFPPRALAFGVTGRVVDAIIGTATSWDLGVAGDAERYGSSLGVSENSWVNGPGTPIVYWSPTELLITARGGTFAGGQLSLVVHYGELALPDPV